MKRILVATDFSTRSDRAMRRATLLARDASAPVALVHVVDDDLPARLLQVEQAEAAMLLHDLATTMRETDGVTCEARLALGDPSQVIADTAEATDADLLVVGPHRRQALRDAFIGTTVERTIRLSRRPTIMANAVPSRSYERILVATDFSDIAAHALRTVRDLGLSAHAEIVVVHAYEGRAGNFIERSGMTESEIKHDMAEEEAHAAAALEEFLRAASFKPADRVVRRVEFSVSNTIREVAGERRADLIVIGTRGQSGPMQFLLGSVAADLLRDAEVDVLAVPPAGG